jgi:uncharacterized protein
MNRLVTDVFFHPMPGRGQRLMLHHRPANAEARGVIVYVHPFAEEMNKSRRMAALQSRAFAKEGYAVVQMDLFGCGDSSGDFGDATWADWLTDVSETASWLRERYDAPLTLWGLRAGCLLASEAAQQLGAQCDLLFWQPPALGKMQLLQFLRLKVASDILVGQAKGTMERLRDQLASGDTVQIAGYRLTSGIAHGLEKAKLLPPPPGGHVAWMEVTARDDADLLPASAQVVERWRQIGFTVSAQVVKGPAFWQTSEIEEAPALLDATLATVAQAAPS